MAVVWTALAGTAPGDGRTKEGQTVDTERKREPLRDEKKQEGRNSIPGASVGGGREEDWARKRGQRMEHNEVGD